MDRATFLKQVELELVMANHSIAFWRDQIAQHPKDPFIRQIAERSLDYAVATVEHLEQTKKSARHLGGFA